MSTDGGQKRLNETLATLNVLWSTRVWRINGTVEYKCPYSDPELTPVEACKHVKGLFCMIEKAKAKLKLNHNYYYQVQGVLRITIRKWCN